MSGCDGLTFYDEATSALVETRSAVMTEVAVGQPAYHAKQGGPGDDAVTITGRAFDLFMARLKELEDARASAGTS